MPEQECWAARRDGALGSELQAAIARAAGLRSRAGSALGEETLFRQAFQELDTAHEELRETEAQLHARADDLANALGQLERERAQAREIFDGAPEAYVLSDATGQIVKANRRAAELLCIDPRFLPRKPLIGFVDRADRARFFELITKAVSGSPGKDEVHLRPRGARPSVACIASVSRAMSEDAEGVLRWMFCELPARSLSPDDELSCCRSQETARLLAQVGQELQTHLSSVSGWLQVVRQNTLEHGAGTRAIASITRAVRSSIGIAERLAEYARLERDDAPLQCVRVSLVELVGQLVDATREMALQRGICLSALLTGGVPAIAGDPLPLQRALGDLLFKVVRSTAPGGELYIAVAPSGSRVLLTLRSTGCGIDLELLEDSESSVPSTIDTDVARARRSLERHGATIQRQAAGESGHSSIEISFPALSTRSVFPGRTERPPDSGIAS